MPAAKTDGWKSKVWYNIVAPDMFGKAAIGETVADVPEKLIGRTVDVSLADLTNDMSKQNIKIILKIDRVGGDTAYTKFIGHRLTQDYLHSLVRRETTNIESSIAVKTKDDLTIRIKPSCFTIKKVRVNQIKGIRETMNSVIMSWAKGLDMTQFILDIVSGKISAGIYHDVKAIYPLRRVEIRKSRIQESVSKGLNIGNLVNK